MLGEKRFTVYSSLTPAVRIIALGVLTKEDIHNNIQLLYKGTKRVLVMRYNKRVKKQRKNNE